MQHAASLFLDSIGQVSSLAEMPGVTEVMVNAPGDVWIERDGVMSREKANVTDASLRGAIRALARLSGQDAVENSPQAIINARVGDMRVAAVLAPTAVDGHALCIRKHVSRDMRLDDYAAAGAFQKSGIDHETVESAADGPVEFFRRAVANRRTILVSGATGSGKTTFVNALIAEIPENERVLTIEDTVELNVRVPNRVRLLSNEQAGITTRDLVRLSLRMRPDRIVVGEVRGGEAFDLLQAFNTGHEGGMATIHANSAQLALHRLATLVMLGAPVGWPIAAIHGLIAQSIDYVAHFRRSGGKRILSEVVCVKGYDDDYILERIL